MTNDFEVNLQHLVEFGKARFKKYPYTEYGNELRIDDEVYALFGYVTQMKLLTDEMIDNIVAMAEHMNDNLNQFNLTLETFLNRFDGKLKDTLTNILTEWQESGVLDVLIDESLQTEMDILEEETHNKLNDFNTQLTQTVYEETIAVKIPTDFPDLQSALDEYSKKRKKQGKIVKLLIETGHRLTKGLHVRHGDYSHFEVVSEDAIVYLSSSFVGAKSLPTDPTDYAFVDLDGALISGVNATMPTLGCVIDMENKYGTGYFLYNSKGLVKENRGVINAGLNGIYCISSHLDARATDFSGASNEGFRAQHGSVFDLMGSNFDNCCKNATGEAAIYISKGSYGGARELSARYSGTNGIRIRRSKVDIERSDFSGAKGLNTNSLNGVGIFLEGKADVSGTGAIANDCSTYGVYATQLSQTSGGITTKNNGVRDIEVLHGSIVMGGETTKSGISGLIPDPSDTNIGVVNFYTGNGLIVSQSQANMIEYESNTNGHVIKWADGTMMTISKLVTHVVSLAVDEISGLLSKPPSPETVKTLLYSNVQAWGKMNADGGGSPVALDLYIRGFSTNTETFRVKNTGVNTITTQLNVPINAVQCIEVVVGRWK